MAESSSLRGEWRYGTFLTLRLTCVVLFAEKIQSLLKTTSGLIDICYECSGTLVDESIDLERVSDQLFELLSILKELFKAAKANTLDSLDIGLSVDVVLSRCKDEISEVDVILKRKSGRKRIEGSSSSFGPPVNLTNLASSITTLRKAVEGYFRCVWTFTKKSDADKIHKGPLL